MKNGVVLMYMVGHRFNLLEMWVQRFWTRLGIECIWGAVSFVEEVESALL